MYGLARSLRNLGLAAGLLLWSGLVMSPATASTIMYHFSGNVTDVDPLLRSQFNTSQPMSADVTVDTTNQAGGNSGAYSIQSFHVTIGTYMATMGSSGVGNVYVVPASGGSPFPFDFFDISVNNLSSDNNIAGFLAPMAFNLQLAGPPGVLTSGALPNPFPSVASFTDSAATPWHVLFSIPMAGLTSEVSGTLTTVPLPAAMILFGVGLVALIGFGAGGLRNPRSQA